MNRIDELKNMLRSLAPEGIALAFSGGVDSSFLLAVLADLKKEFSFPLTVLFARSVFQRADELFEAEKLAEQFGEKLQVLDFDPLKIEEIKNNSPQRCYYCKNLIFKMFREFADNKNAVHLLDGTNADDRKSYRPGLRALSENRVISPLAELGFTKNEIREIAGKMGWKFSSWPSTPCLATRFDYGTLLDTGAISRMKNGEAFIRKYLPPEADLRLRFQSGSARIETNPRFMQNIVEHSGEIVSELKKLDFKYIVLDLEGFRSGSFDRTTTMKMEA